MIPICLVTGFLGSGKTTLLSNIIRANQGRRLAYLVNEFSQVDVDGQVLAELGENVYALPGGSIFCRCLVTQFVAQMKKLAELGGWCNMLEGLVVEASGIANPKVIEQMLHETGLDAHFELGTIVTVIDPGTILKLLATLGNIKAQIEAADLILVNKVDVYGREEVDAAVSAVRAINDRAKLHEVVRCDYSFDPFARCGHDELEGEYAKCKDPNYEQVVLPFALPVDVEQLKEHFERYAEAVYRVKGYIPTAEGSAYVDYAGGRLTVEESDKTIGFGQLVCIVDAGVGEEVVGGLKGV